MAKHVTAEHPDLNVLINNAGIMEPDQAAGVIDDKLLVSTVTTNLLGPVRTTSALVDQLKSRRRVILYSTSVLGFVPLAVTAVYSATKAALHSYVLSQRFLLRNSGGRRFMWGTGSLHFMWRFWCATRNSYLVSRTNPQTPHRQL